MDKVFKALADSSRRQLLDLEWHGRNKLHYLNVAPIGEINDRWIGKYERHRVEALRELKKKLEEEKND